MRLFVDEQNLTVIVYAVIARIERQIKSLTPEAIALGVGEIAVQYPELFDISLDDSDNDADIQYIDIKPHGDGRIAAIGLDGFGVGNSIAEAVGWLLFISNIFDELPNAIALALQS